MATLQSTNVVGTLCVNGVAVGGGKDFKYCCITASQNWTPTSGFVDGDGRLDLHLIGGGGGGGGILTGGTGGRPQGTYYFQSRCASYAPGSGDAGEVQALTFNVTATDACCVVIGAGGVGGAITGSTGLGFQDTTASIVEEKITTAGGHSCFGSDITASGGSGGENKSVYCFIRNQGQNITCNYTITCPGPTTCGPTVGGGHGLFYGQGCDYTTNGRFTLMAQYEDPYCYANRNYSTKAQRGFIGVGCCDDYNSVYLYCASQAGQSPTANPIPSYTTNQATNADPNPLFDGLSYGHAGATGVACLVGGTNTPIFGSGSSGAQGIAVLRWYE